MHAYIYIYQEDPCKDIISSTKIMVIILAFGSSFSAIYKPSLLSLASSIFGYWKLKNSKQDVNIKSHLCDSYVWFRILIRTIYYICKKVFSYPKMSFVCNNKIVIDILIELVFLSFYYRALNCLTYAWWIIESINID